MPKLTLNVMGGFQAFLDGEPITTFTSDKTRALLAYLVVEADRIHRRESLCALLWPNVPENSARQSLSQALSILRKALKDDANANPFLLTNRDTVQFNPKSDYELDSGRLRDISISNPQSPVSINRGPFLNGFSIPDAEGFEEWALLQREALQRVVLEQLDQVVVHNIEQRHYSVAIEAARMQLEIDPWREEAHRSLMRTYALNGQRSDALAQYEKCKHVLRQALGVEPSHETQALLAHIQKDEVLGKLHSEPAEPAPSRTLVLPTVLTPFIGREDELNSLAEVLANPAARLITLVGAGGMGKTRLAIEVAAQVRDQFADGVAFVSLASVPPSSTNDAAIASAIANALSLNLFRRGDTQSDLREEVMSVLRDEAMLLVLDNFEHLLNAESAGFITRLLQTAPRLKLLITSREALDVPGEWMRDVYGLGSDARDLFVQSAQRAQVGFVPNADDERAIQRIGNLVGGMPLGVELAASWVRLLSCAEIAEEIHKNIAFLSTNARQVPERHRSITAVFEHTWGLLADAERCALMQLALFSGGFTREAASAVVGATLPLLSALVSKSLVRRVDARRFDLHELIRQFALERITDRMAAADAHARYFVVFASANNYESLPAEHHTRFAEISRERGNIEVACAHLLSGDGIRAAQLLGSLLTLWLSEQNDTAFGLVWVTRTRQRLAEVAKSSVSSTSTKCELSVATQVQLLSAQITMLAFTADVTALADELATANDLLRVQLAPAAHTWAYGLAALAWVRIRQGRMAEALSQLEAALPIFRGVGDLFGLAWALRGLSLALMAQQQFEASLNAIKACVAVSRKLNDRRGLAMALGGQAERERAQGELREAMVHYTESAQLFEALGDSHNLLMCKLNHLGAYILLGSRSEADAMTHDIARMIVQSGELPRGHARAYALLNLAGSELLVNAAPGRSAQLLSASVAVLGQHNNALQPADKRTFNHIHAELAQRLPEAQLALQRRLGETGDDEALLREALGRFN